MTIRKGEKAASNNSLNSDTKKCKFFEQQQQNEHLFLKAMQVLIMLKILNILSLQLEASE